MKITDIKKQKRRDDRFNIYIDGKYKFALCEEEMVKAKIEIGKELEKKELEGLREKDERSKVTNKSYEYLARRNHSEKELREKLRRKQYRSDLIDKTIERLKDIGYLDDGRFCREYIVSRTNSSPRGTLQLRRELLQKGIESDLIDKTVELVYNRDEEQKALGRLIKIKKRRFDKVKKGREKLISFLLRRGFLWEDIKEKI